MHRFLIGAVCAAAMLFFAAPAAGFVVHLRAPNHHPKVGEPWRIKVSARTNSGRDIHAAALYKFIYNGSVVSTQYPSPHSGPQGPERHRPYHFFGSFIDRLYFPKRAVGIPLRFRVVVRAGPLGTKHVDYGISVVR
jgi:hypothetical protein